MSYKIDYFKLENHHLYRQLNLTDDEYLKFLDICRFLKNEKIKFINSMYENFKNLTYNDQLISIVDDPLSNIKIIEHFYNDLRILWLEQRINQIDDNLNKINGNLIEMPNF